MLSCNRGSQLLSSVKVLDGLKIMDEKELILGEKIVINSLTEHLVMVFEDKDREMEDMAFRSALHEALVAIIMKDGTCSGLCMSSYVTFEDHCTFQCLFRYAALPSFKSLIFILSDICLLEKYAKQALDICIVSFNQSASSVFVLGERNFFCLKDNGQIRFMKKLDWSPSCFLPYCSVSEGTINTLIANHNNMLHIYQDVTLKWATQLPHIPVAVRVGCL
ncbi:hypothetical protein H8959_008461, partial [Pygathrix nigripes]